MRDRGFVLLNALVLVAAMAGVAAYIMAQSEAGRVRLSAAQTADQLEQYLDGFEAYAMMVLAQERSSVTASDGSWRIDAAGLPLDRGEVSGSIVDLERKFNLNWLAIGNAPDLPDVLDQVLVAAKGRPGLADMVSEALFPGVPSNARAYRALDPPLDPVGGVLSVPHQLRDIPGLTPTDLAKLDQVATVIPPDSKLNINTAAPEIIAAFFPNATLAQISRVLAPRNEEPFTSIDAFRQQVEIVQGVGIGTDTDITLFTVRGTWFELTTTAKLQGHTARRTTVLERKRNGVLPRVVWRVTQQP